MSIEELYQELIIDHGTSPRNHFVLNPFSHEAEGFNPLCGDRIKLYLQVEEKEITALSFVGSGCAISQASASIMTEKLKGMDFKQALSVWDQFQALLTHQSLNIELLGKLEALAGVKAFPSRIKCATLAWHTFLSAIQAQKA